MGDTEPCSRRLHLSVEEHPLLLDNVLHLIFSFLDSPPDRRNVSEVCKKWHEMDRETRSHVYVAFIYSVLPSTLTSRFTSITSLKLKAKPRAYEFNLLPNNWGGHVTPWLLELVPAYRTLSSLHLRRMEVRDDDLGTLASGFRNTLQSLKLDFCSGFSTKGLREITHSCRYLKVLYLENSEVQDEGDDWLHELALHNRDLEVLSFQLCIGVVNVNVEDIKTIIQNCPRLTSLKLVEALGNELRQALSRSTSLKELGVFLSVLEEEEVNSDVRLQLPKNLTSISGDIPLCLYWPIASHLVKLDLMTVTSINAEQHHELLGRCPRLQNLQVRTIIGDEGLGVVGRCCKDLKKIRIEEQNDEGAYVSHVGLTALVHGCNQLTKLAIYVSDISNSALISVGQCCPNLVDFRIILIENVREISEAKLDSGFEGIMRGCKLLTRLCIYVRQGTVTDQGLARIGRYSNNLKALLLGCVGESDEGFLSLARGCTRLERLEMRDCPFTDDALVQGAGVMEKLKLLWIQGFKIGDIRKLQLLLSKYNVECTNGSPVQCLIYKSLAGPRMDCPEEVFSPVAARVSHGWAEAGE